MKKRTILWTMAAALTLTGCTQDELVGGGTDIGNAITFGTYVGRGAQTRATEVNNGTLKQTGFVVNAWYTKTEEFYDGIWDADAERFMENTRVSYNAAKDAWTYSPLKYWPNNAGDLVSFFAYGPYAPENSNLALDNSGTSVSYTVSPNVKEQVDLIYNTNYNDAIDQPKPSVEDKVEFQFDHALSRIAFSVEAAVDVVESNKDQSLNIDGNTVINVKRVALVGAGVMNGSYEYDPNAAYPEGPFYTDGVLTLMNPGTTIDEDTNEETPNSPWNLLSDTRQSFFLDADDFYRTVTVYDEKQHYDIEVVQLHKFNRKQRLTDDDAYLMIIPQDLRTAEDGGTSEGFKIYIEYDVITESEEKDDEGNPLDRSVITNHVVSDAALSLNFEQGKAYNFNLVLGMTSVKFNANVTAWDETTPEQDEWLPENTAKEIQGLGTEQNPYEIWTLDNLMEMRDNINGNDAREVPEGGQPWASAVYKQMDDVTVTSTSRANESWEPISEFSGTYLGNNKRIIGLTISNEETSGNYAWIAMNNNGTIQDLTVEAYITTGANTAAIVGTNIGTVSNCTVTGTLSGVQVGGIVCFNQGSIAGCSNNGTIETTNKAGGIAYSSSAGASIKQCLNYASITSTSTDSQAGHVGGIVAENGGEVENCSNYGELSGMRIGGIAGEATSDAVVTACFNEGTIIAPHEQTQSAGIVGVANGSTITACYNKGAVKAADGVTLHWGAGGIVGYNLSTTTIQGCYHSNDESDSKCGGILGYNGTTTATFTGNYYDGVSQACGFDANATGLGTKVDDEDMTWATAKTAMNNVLNVLYANGTNPQYNWKYVESTTTPPLTLEVGVAEYVDLPYTNFEKAEDAVGEVPTLYIKSAADLAGLSKNVANGFKYNDTYSYAQLNYIQVADIDLSTECSETLGSWTPIGNSTNKFSGTYTVDKNGESDQYYVINNLYITVAEKDIEYQGLFGYVTNAEMKNIRVASGNVTFSGDNSGAVIGYASKTTIENCSYGGTVKPFQDGQMANIGGVIGMAEGDYSKRANYPIIQCYFDGNYTAGWMGGCVLGDAQYVLVKDCYNSGEASFSGPSNGGYTGGVVGDSNNSDIVHCWNSGTLNMNDNKANIAGVVGHCTNSNIIACYNIGTISGKNVAGIVAWSTSRDFIEKCYNVGNLTGTKSTTGIAYTITDESTSINSCYNTSTGTTSELCEYHNTGSNTQRTLIYNNCFGLTDKTFNTNCFMTAEGSTYYQIGENVKWYDENNSSTEGITYALELLNHTYDNTYSEQYEFVPNEDAETKDKQPLVLKEKQ